MAVDLKPPRWRALCEAAQNEQDPDKLMQLVQEINKELDKSDKPEERPTEPRE